MTGHSPFDHAPDPAIGEALREVLSVGEDPAFVQRVLERTRMAEPWWEILGDWARPSVAAAMVVVAAVGFLLGRVVAPPPTDLALSEPVSAGMVLEVSVLMSDGGPPDVETILGEGSR